MIRSFGNFLNLRLRGKILGTFLPLVILPIFLIGGVTGIIATRQTHFGILQVGKNDLDHMVFFTVDLLDADYHQMETYHRERRQMAEEEATALTNLVYTLINAQYQQHREGRATLEEAQAVARNSLTSIHSNKNHELFLLDGSGTILFRDPVHPDLFPRQDGTETVTFADWAQQIVNSPQRRISFATQDGNDRQPAEEKIVTGRYFRPWDWVIVTVGAVAATPGNQQFPAAFKHKISGKHVGQTGTVFCLDQTGLLTVHPTAEGQNIADLQDAEGRYFIREMLRKKSGWLSYPWQGPQDDQPRMKIVRYRYYQPLGWIVAADFYEDELFHETHAVNWRIVISVCLLSAIVGTIAVILTIIASRVLTDPIRNMIAVIRQVKRGRLDRRVPVESNDELGELAAAFNKMIGIIRHNREMEASLAQQGKMASLGVLSSGVAHEINNPLGVILGYASYLEGKMLPDDPYYKYIHEIKRESKRCKKIVQDLLSYARTPKPHLAETDIHELLHQIVDFAANHTDMHHVTVHKEFAPALPHILVDGDQLRQVAINLILNAGAAMQEGGQLIVKTGFDDQYVNIVFSDNGSGIPEENLGKIFEPFFTTRVRGTGLGLAITKQIVEQHQGIITLDSTVGKGTTITVRLPILRKDELNGPEKDLAD